MNSNGEEDKLKAMLIAADRALPPAYTAPLQLAALQRRMAQRTAQHAAIVAFAASVALFAALVRPALIPLGPITRTTARPDADIAALTREADLIRRSALTTLAECDRTRPSLQRATAAASPVADISAAAENAAFLLYCEADRLAKKAETAEAARERYTAVAERFPGTVWARMASELIPSTRPIEKG